MQLGEWGVQVIYDQFRSPRERRFVISRFDGTNERFVTTDGGFWDLKPSQDEAKLPPNVFFTFRDEHMQPFMDALWKMGIRPTDRRFEKELDLQGKLIEGLKYHLEDMREKAGFTRKQDK